MFAKKSLSPPAFKALGKPTEQYRVKNVEVNVWIPAKSGKPTLTTALVQSEKEYVFIFDTDEQAVREILQSIEALN